MVDIRQTFEEMKRHGMSVPTDYINIKVPNSEQLLKDSMKAVLEYEDREFKWHPAYTEVSKWLTNNEGKGLFMFGNCGLGKSLLGRLVIPAIILKIENRVINVFDMDSLNDKIDLALSKRLVTLDDIGTEDVAVNFGARRMAVAEIIDNAEKKKNLLILTSNLSNNDLLAKYGVRVLDRLKSITKRVLFEGESFR